MAVPNKRQPDLYPKFQQDKLLLDLSVLDKAIHHESWLRELCILVLSVIVTYTEVRLRQEA